MENILTGAMAIVYANGKEVGKMRDVSITERIQRTPIQELGNPLSIAVPATSYNGDLTCTFFEVNYSLTGMPNYGHAGSNEAFADALRLDETGFQLDVYKKVNDYMDEETGLPRSKKKPYLTIAQVFYTGSSVTIPASGQVATRTQNFVYIGRLLFR